MTHGSLFSGIGGFDLAAEWMGWENKFHCEFNSFCQKVLKYYWPNAHLYEDITKSDFTFWRGKIDILTGGFPCQPYSTAGKRLGKEDSRYLWPEMRRVIREVKPRWVVGENVRGLVSWNGGMVFNEVQADLESEGYEVFPVLLPAAGVNAPHLRFRIFFIAYCQDGGYGATTESDGRQEHQSLNREAIRNQFNADGSIRSIVNTENTGGSDGLGQVQATNGEVSERNNDAKFSDSGNGSTTNTQGNGRGGRSSEECENGERKLFQGKQEWNQMGSEVEGCGGERNASDPNSIGFCGNSTTERLQFETFGTRNRMGEESNASDFEGKRQQSQQAGTAEFRPSQGSGLHGGGSFGKIDNWGNFPTVSPIHAGDDGLSDKLDGITFSKWRKESIKAAGNAIVPQVVYQIFKAIEVYEKTKDLPF